MKIAREQGSAVRIRHGPATVNDVNPCPESHCPRSGWEGGQCVVVSQETYLNPISHGSFRGKAVKRGSLPTHRA